MNLKGELNNLSLIELEALIVHYNDKLNEVCIRNSFSASIGENEKKKDLMNSGA